MAAEEFSQLARRGENGFLRYAVAAPMVLFLSLSATGLFFYPVRSLAERDGDPNTFFDERTFEVVGYPVLSFAALMLGFSAIWAGLYVLTKVVHRRPFLTLVTPGRRVDWRRVAQGSVLFLVPTVPLFLAEYLLRPSGFEPNFDAWRFILFVPLVLVLVPIQAGAEELLTRGYLLQGLGLLTRNALVLSVVTGVLFALPHLANSEVPAVGDGFVPAFLSYAAFGFFAGLITIRDNGLELALGLHAANNAFVFLVVSVKENPDTPSVFVVPAAELDPVSALAGTVVAFAVFWVLAFWVFGRRKKDPLADARGGEAA